MAFKNDLVTCLSNLKDGFDQNELAFSGLTGGAENAVRDRLAFRLHSTLQAPLVVSREWRKVDLCLMNDERSSVEAALQLKAGYTFDVLCRGRSYFNAAEKDLQKAQKRVRKHSNHSKPSFYNLLLIFETCNCPDELPDGIIKYFKGIRACHERIRENEDRRGRLRDAIHKNFQGAREIGAGSIDAGECFGTKCDMFWWLHKMC